MKTLWNREPAAILAVVGALVSLAIAFGLKLSADQQGGIMAAVVAVLGLITRSQVTPGGQ